MNLENLNLVELNAQEKKKTEGGTISPFWGFVVAGLAWDILSSPGAAGAAFMRGYNAQI